MIDFEGFEGEALRLSLAEIEELAASFDVEVAALRAVIAVEASGSGFDSENRPKILFEPHVFHRLLSGIERQEAVDAGLAYPKWGMRPYPRGSDAQYDRLEDAMRINQDAALKSCSWGMGQVMGFNHKLAGYDEVGDMVWDAMESERNHIHMMMSFIENARLLPTLRNHDWVGFARGYNGPGFAKNAYDTKLASAYRQYV